MYYIYYYKEKRSRLVVALGPRKMKHEHSSLPLLLTSWILEGMALSYWSNHSFLFTEIILEIVPH